MAIRKVVKEATVTGPLILDDLRWLVEECEGYAGDSRVSVEQRRDAGQIDHDPDRITVHGKDPDGG